MMKRGLFLTHINQIRFRLDVGQRKMTNDKLEMTNEKGEEGGWEKEIFLFNGIVICSTS